MKYLKTFESIKLNENPNKYWKLRTKMPFLEIGLKKIGMKDDDIKFLISEDPSSGLSQMKREKMKKIFVGIKPDEWGWSEDEGNFIGLEAGENYEYEYMGEVDITKKDIEKWKFEQDVKKYNL